ncbi:MAG: NusG domain II-containing protein [Lachnospiraceae bacterium]|nr:NusG domain II-containing protein [Lachnospiraceae bacterium]MBQ9234614.1 NusG domain II-containing protein [Lachnospiraceae bacterium]
MIEKDKNNDGKINDDNIDDDKINNKIISKRDLIFILILLALSIVIVLIMHFNKRTGYNVRISADGKTVKTLSLDKDTEYVFESDKGYNIVVIKDGEVCVKEADCPDKICVNHKKISNVGETIICLPHKLVVEITE